MKRIVLINTVLYGSTGTIVRQLKNVAKDNGMEAYTVTAYARKDTTRRDDHDIVVGSFLDRYLHVFLSRITGYSGMFSYFATKILVTKLRKINPDIIHLHNLHNAYINLPVLFRYIKKERIKAIWTLHDCWAFTGRCPHFEMLGCDKWKTSCAHCEYPKRDYPISYVDRSSKMWTLKNRIFNGVENMTIVTPSEWLSNLVKQSLLAKYPVEVINNGITLTAFKPTEGKTLDAIKKLGKYIVLGVAMDWGRRKGLDIFVELSKQLDKDYRVVLVGTTESIEKELEKYDITCIRKTRSQEELAEIYTSADVFVNPTREDNFPTVNMEAIACGTPVITFETGGSPEVIDESCGVVVAKEDVDGLKKEIVRICKEKPISSLSCTNKAREYNDKDRFAEYIKLYEVK